MRNDQKKFLKDRVSETYRLWRNRLPGGMWGHADNDDAPANVKKAQAEIEKLERVVRKWKKTLKQRHERAEAKLKAEHRKAQEALLFHDAAKALKAVEAFERQVPKA